MVKLWRPGSLQELRGMITRNGNTMAKIEPPKGGKPELVAQDGFRLTKTGDDVQISYVSANPHHRTAQLKLGSLAVTLEAFGGVLGEDGRLMVKLDPKPKPAHSA